MTNGLQPAIDRVEHYKQLFEAVTASLPENVVGVVLEQIGKDTRLAAMRQTERNNSNGEQATEKQLNFLKFLGVKDIPAGLSKTEASRLIDEKQQAELTAAA